VKLNVGQVTRDVTIDGETTVAVPGDVPSTGDGGLYALSSNMGHHRNSQWTVLPEFQAKLGYQVTRCWTAYAGYNLLIWPHVARASEQIDPVVNTDLLPPPLVPTNGPARPVFSDPTSTLWIQGLTLGITGRF